MPNHTTTVVIVGTGTWRCKCSCREAGPVTDSHWEAEKWGIGHRHRIERIRLHLDTEPTLKKAAKLYREAAANTEIPKADRDLFAQMAAEIEHRLYGPDNPPEQLALFDQERSSHGPTSTRRRTTHPPGH